MTDRSMTALERAARAAQAEMIRQMSPVDDGHPDGPGYEGTIDAALIALAVVRALREPDEAMLDAMEGDVHISRERLTAVWQAAIDSILAGEGR